MRSLYEYLIYIYKGIVNLLLGMKITMINLFRPKITEQYPENRDTMVMFDRFRGALRMPHNEKNEHKCTACGLCQMNCPNGSITVISKTETDVESGKVKRVLERYQYDLGSCIFCDICVQVCPQDAIEWSQEFEHSVFTRSKLVQQLNNEGSTLWK